MDLVGDESKMGKKTQSDVEQEKVTYPYFIGMDASLRQVEELTASAKKVIAEGGIPASSRLLEIPDYLMKGDH